MMRTSPLLLACLLVPALAPAQGQSRLRKPTADAAPVRFTLAPAGNEARFIAREQLMANTIENDAVGSTTAITGAVVIDAGGRVNSTASQFVVHLDSLRSDRSMRDRYIKSHTIDTDQYPTARLTIRELRGFPSPIPTSGSMTFTLIGDLTMHGVTRSTSWDVSATADKGGFSGTASTTFKFEDFGMSAPHVPVVASVRDDIRLQYDFRLVRATDP